MSTRTLTFPAAGNRTLSWLLWFSFNRQVIHGLHEQVLDMNPGLADMGTKPPGGTVITVPSRSPSPVVQPVLVKLYN